MSKAQDFLGFICQLTQTALNKSTQSLLILIDGDVLTDNVDNALWAHDATSFIPHQRLAADMTIDSSLAPVLLSSYLPTDFNGIVINTTSRPVTDFMTSTGNSSPTRILEIIKPDDRSMQEGRDKYKYYQKAGYELTHFKV